MLVYMRTLIFFPKTRCLQNLFTIRVVSKLIYQRGASLKIQNEGRILESQIVVECKSWL